jgi:Papain family cysteine protease
MGQITGHFSKRVKDQGDRPTCVAFAVTALHEYWREVILTQLTAANLDLSPEFLYYGCKQKDNLAGAEGTTVVAAGEWLKPRGQCRESLHPYQAGKGALLKPSVAAFTDGLSRTVDRLVKRSIKWQTLANDLGKGLPVVGVITLFQSAYRANSRGELLLPTANELKLGLHAVLFIEMEGKGTGQTVVFLNSWGKNWGDGGMGRLGPAYFAKFCKELWTIERRKA